MPRLLASLLLALTPLLASAEEVIRVYNWNDYIAPQVLKDFEAQTGIRVEYHTYSTAEELQTVLASGEAIDVAVPSHDTLPTMIKSGSSDSSMTRGCRQLAAARLLAYGPAVCYLLVEVPHRGRAWPALRCRPRSTSPFGVAR